MISIVIPVYKVEPYLKRCVDSVLNQSYGDFELILVDDGSPDNCGRICDEYATLDNRVRVIHKENGGVSSARNAGLDAAQGEYISFVDSDDWLHPQALELLMQAMEEYQPDAVTMDNTWVSTDDVSMTPLAYADIPRTRYTGDDIRKNLYRFVYAPDVKDVITCGLYGIYRSHLFKAVRFDEELASAEDVDVIFRLNMGVSSVVHLKAYLYFYYTGNESATRSALNQNQLTMLTALLKIGNTLTQAGRADGQKMFYRYIYCFFDYDLRIARANDRQLLQHFEQYKEIFLASRKQLCKNKYLSLLEKLMIEMYLGNHKEYRMLFGKCERHMLRKLQSFLN